MAETSSKVGNEKITNAFYFNPNSPENTNRDEERAFRELLNSRELSREECVRLFGVEERSVWRYAKRSISTRARRTFCQNAGIDYDDFLRGVWTPLRTLDEPKATEGPEPTQQSRETALALSVTGFCLTILTAAPLSFAIWRAIVEERGIDSASIIILVISAALFICGQMAFRLRKAYSE